MKISCVMSVYNEEKWMIDRAINSMLNQSYKLFEIIVVIDNPKREDLVEYISNSFNSSIPIITIINPKNYGLPRSLNIGISKANGDYICRMDSDDESLPLRIEKSIVLMKKEKVNFVTTRVNVVDEHGEPCSNLSRNYVCSCKGIRKVSRYISCTVHPTWIFSKKIWEEVGGYREELFSAQDYDFNIRALKAGYDLVTVNEPLLNYTFRESSISGKNKTKQVFLMLIIQNNVYKNGIYSESLIEEIKDEINIQYLHFKEMYIEYKKSKNAMNKLVVAVLGAIRDKYFRQLLGNAIMWKIENIVYK